MIERDRPQEQEISRNGKGQFLPGTTGNPGGRVPGSISLVTILKKHLEEHPEEAQAVIAGMVKQGKIGNMVATKEMLDRIDGKVAETHRITGELPVKIMFVPASQVLGTDTLESLLGQQEEALEGEYEVLPEVEAKPL